MASKIFIFDQSRGAGVPGLPHEVSEEQAKDLGLADVLKEAVANGSYKEKAAPAPKAQVVLPSVKDKKE